MHLNITLCKWKTTPWSNVFSISPRNTLFGFPKEQKIQAKYTVGNTKYQEQVCKYEHMLLYVK